MITLISLIFIHESIICPPFSPQRILRVIMEDKCKEKIDKAIDGFCDDLVELLKQD